MNDQKIHLPVDTTLSYENARLQGYQWVMDVLRNDQGSIEELEAIVKLLREEGCKLGQPWANDTSIAPYGLYKPLKKSTQLQKKVWRTI